MKRIRLWIPLAALAAGLCAWSGRADAGTMDKGLIGQAGDIIAYLKTNNYHNVGVLPFKVKKGTRQELYAGGPIGPSMPDRLENALIMAMEPNEKLAVGIIRDATTTANKANVGPFASNKASFDKLFSTTYQRAWGADAKSKAVKADGFLTGTISNVGDRAKTSVAIQLFDSKSFTKNGPKPVHEWKFEVKTDHQLMAELGYNFALSRSMLKRGTTVARRDQAVQQQVQQEEQQGKQQPDPALSQDHSPDNIKGFAYELLYDGEKQTITKMPGTQQGSLAVEWQAPPAKQSTKIQMALTRKVGGSDKLGVLMLVNGESTWKMEKGNPELNMSRWIMAPNTKDARQVWDGMYIDLEGKNLRRWKTLSAEESLTKASELGNRAGWIDLYVFGSGEEPVQVKDEKTMFVSTRSMAKASESKTLKDLRTTLMKRNNVKVREVKDAKGAVVRRDAGGLIYYELEPEVSPKIDVDNLPNPVMLGHLSIRYWDKPGKVIEGPKGDQQ